ncbi:hypothetical protein RhiirA4_543143 [Rhizophagus irregularis]|uniref:Uncharacterized protein n=1 Tax=Rhizophagus irregularis TaxID=588596 RepID=A0A2I1GHV5_9GLOM|nr:hypothetical protein RhiirA4_543143 [Rhizophagus irregularis]
MFNFTNVKMSLRICQYQNKNCGCQNYLNDQDNPEKCYYCGHFNAFHSGFSNETSNLGQMHRLKKTKSTTENANAQKKSKTIVISDDDDNNNNKETKENTITELEYYRERELALKERELILRKREAKFTQ